MKFVTKRIDLGRDVDIHAVAEAAFDPETIRKFHGPNTSVGPWTLPDTRYPHVHSRVVTFDMPLPSFLRQFVQDDVVAIQTRHWDANGCVRVNSSTTLGVHPIFTVKFDGNRHVIFETDVAIRAPNIVPRPLRGIAERVACAVASRDFERYVQLVAGAVSGG